MQGFDWGPVTEPCLTCDNSACSLQRPEGSAPPRSHQAADGAAASQAPVQPQAGPPENSLLWAVQRGQPGPAGLTSAAQKPFIRVAWALTRRTGPWLCVPTAQLSRVCSTLFRQIFFKLTILLKSLSSPSACRLDSSPRRQKPSEERAFSFLPPQTPPFLPLSSG